MMEIKREYCDDGKDAGYFCVVRAECKASSMRYLNLLRLEIRKDFPEILSSEIEVIRFSSRYLAGKFGLVFRRKGLPYTYNKVSPEYFGV